MQLVEREEAGHLGLRHVDALRRVHDVALEAHPQVAPDRARSGLAAVGDARHLAHDAHRVDPLPTLRHDRKARHELGDARIERLVDVVGVVLGEQGGVEPHHLAADEQQALALEPRRDLADQPARERVGLDQNQGPFHGG